MRWYNCNHSFTVAACDFIGVERCRCRPSAISTAAAHCVAPIRAFISPYSPIHRSARLNEWPSRRLRKWENAQAWRAARKYICEVEHATSDSWKVTAILPRHAAHKIRDRADIWSTCRKPFTPGPPRSLPATSDHSIPTHRPAKTLPPNISCTAYCVMRGLN